jgi:hypothetical protein
MDMVRRRRRRLRNSNVPRESDFWDLAMVKKQKSHQHATTTRVVHDKNHYWRFINLVVVQVVIIGKG